MKFFSLILLLFFSFSIAQYRENSAPVKKKAKYLSTVSSSFTDFYKYNTLSHAKCPIGILETEDAIVSLNLGYRYSGLESYKESFPSKSSHGILAPNMLIGIPEKLYFGMNYSISPTEASLRPGGNDNTILKMPFNSFGLFFAAQTKDGRFKCGLNGQGYYAKRNDAGNKERIILGVDDIGFGLGSRLHDAVSLEFYGHSAGLFDSLNILLSRDTSHKQDRYAWVQLPQIDIAADVGSDDIPYFSNFVFSYARNYFVWVSNVYSDINSVDVLEFPPIVTDSIGLDWQNLWNISYNNTPLFQPAVNIGYWRNRIQLMRPGDPYEPLTNSGAAKDSTWETKSFRIGIGNSVLIKDYAKLWVEYSYATLGLEITGDILKENVLEKELPEKHGYNRVGFGFTTNFDEIPAFNIDESVDLYFNCGFLFIQENLLYTSYRSETYRFISDYLSGSSINLNERKFGSKSVLKGKYEPWLVMHGEVETRNLSFGFGASFLNKIVNIEAHMGIINQRYHSQKDDSQDIKYKGLEFGIDLKYNRFDLGFESKDTEKVNSTRKVNSGTKKAKVEAEAEDEDEQSSSDNDTEITEDELDFNVDEPKSDINSEISED